MGVIIKFDFIALEENSNTNTITIAVLEGTYSLN